MNPHTDEIQRIAVFGLGSSHGDDQFGWAVVDELNQRFGMEARKTDSPIDLIESIGVFDRVILIDAAAGLPDEVMFQKLDCGDAAD